MPRRFSGPLLPGTRSVRTLNRRPKRRMSTKKTSSLTSMIKRVSLSQVETKRKSAYSEGINLGHNITHYVDRIMATKQGVQNPSGADNIVPDARIGNEIIAKGLSIKFYLDSLESGASTHFKIVVFKYPTRVLQGPGVNDNLLWQGAAGLGNNNVLRIIDTVATNRVKILKQVILRPRNFLTKYHDIYIDLKNTKIRYNEDAASDPQLEDIAFAVVACDTFGTATGNHVANLNYNMRFTFKDP